MKKVWSVIYSNKKFPKAKQCRFSIFYSQDHCKNIYQDSFCYEFIPGFNSYLTLLTWLQSLNLLCCGVFFGSVILLGILEYALVNMKETTLFFHSIWTCFYYVIRKIKVKFSSLVFTNMFLLPLSNVKNNDLLQYCLIFLRIVQEISLPWFLLVFALKERCERDFLLGKQKPCPRDIK